MSLERKVLISTVPFGAFDSHPLDLLQTNNIEYVINPLGRRLREDELTDMVGECRALIAGTEPVTARVMDRSPNLGLIARVGIGLDSVDLDAARQRGILVSYTPDAPSAAVAELTIGLMLSLLRCIPDADRGLHHGRWERYMGRRLGEVTVGVIGVGRIGKRVVRHLAAFGARVLANDLAPDAGFGNEYNLQWVDKEVIYKEADIITLHVPLTPLTEHLITRNVIELMKPDALLVNTARGGIVAEDDLAAALRAGGLGAAALDVFECEPYSGELAALDNCLLTCHMGSMSRDCRTLMELEAVLETIRFLDGESLLQLAPEPADERAPAALNREFT